MIGGLPWETVIAACSLVVSVVALLVSYRAQREANAAQRRIVEIEEQRERDRQMQRCQARLQPELRRQVSGSYRLYLVNHGESEARNIRVRLDGKPIREHCAAVQGDTLPDRVGPGGEVSCLLAISLDCAPPY